MRIEYNNNVFFLNTKASNYGNILNDTEVLGSSLITNPVTNESYSNILNWATNPNAPELLYLQGPNTNIETLFSNILIYINKDVNNWESYQNDRAVNNQRLIINSANNPSFGDIILWASQNNKFVNIPSVQDYLLGTIDISFCSGPDGYNSNTVGILLDLNGNQFPIDNSGITYSNKGNIDADVMLYTRNTNEIYVRCKANSSYNGFYLYSTIFNISRTDPSTNSTQIFDSSRNSDISNAYLTTSTKTSDLSGDSFISTSDVYNPVSHYELKFSGLDSSYNFFVRENYFFIQADARCLSGTLYKSCLIDLSTNPQRIGVISLA